MARKLTVCACALVALLLLCSDASACGKRRGGCYVQTYSSCGPVYDGHASGYGYAPGSGGYGAGYAPAYGGYGYGGYGYGGYGYNPGGLGGPRSGLGVRPGPGFGGLGPRR